MSAELAFNRSIDVHYGVAEEVSPGVLRIVANNPSAYTFLGTNTYLVGSEELAIIDPGPADEQHLKAIVEATKGMRIKHILVTHSHRDHCDGARALQEALGGEILSFGPTETVRGAGAAGLGSDFVDEAFIPDRKIQEGEEVRGRGYALDVLHTPGHAPDHLCFALVGQRTMFTGDHVMGWNTTVIAPPEGNMANFLTSMQRLLKRNDKVFLPAHGGRVMTPQRVVKAYVMHRQWRENTILACLDEGGRTIPQIVTKIHGGLDPELKDAASLSVLAHLEYLGERNLVTSEGRGLAAVYTLVAPASRAS